MTYKLRIKDEDGKSTLVPMNRDLITVGRKEGMTIRLTEKNVSREHARIINEDGDIYVEDTSRYGTCINGSRIKGEKKRVEPGDVVLIGDYELSVEGKAAKAAKAAPKAEAPKPKPKPKKSKRVGGPSGDTAMISLDELAKRERAAGRRRVDADVATLFIVNTDLKGTELSLEGDDLILGRTDPADVIVNHTSISAQHAQLTHDAGKYRIEDLGSSNGLKINGEYYERSVLRRGDMLELGHVRMRFIEPGEVFVYNPEEYEEGYVDEIIEKKGGSKAAIWLVLLVLIAGGLAAAYFLYFGKETKLTSVSTKPAATAGGTGTAAEGTKAPAGDEEGEAKAQEVEPGAGTAAAAGGDDSAGAKPVAAAAAGTEGGDDTAAAAAGATGEDTGDNAGDKAAPPEVGDPAQADLDAGNEHLKKEAWDDAITSFNAALGKNAESKAAKDGLAKARGEKAVFEAYNSVKSKVDAKDLKGAWEVASKVPAPGEESVYHNRYSSLLKGVKASYVKELLDAGKDALGDKKWQDAMNAANDVLAIDEDNRKATSIKGKASRGIKKDLAERRKIAKADKPKTTKKEPKTTKKEPKTTKKEPKTGSSGGTSAMSSKDLYRAGRKLLSQGQKDAALNMFQKAAAKGYSKAYKLMGNIYLQKGQTGKAKSMYKKYLRLRPGASDAEAIKATIIRLGG